MNITANSTNSTFSGLFASNGCFYGEEGAGMTGTNMAIFIEAIFGLFLTVWLEVPFFRLRSKQKFPSNVLPHA